jgi:hypothetical protein
MEKFLRAILNFFIHFFRRLLYFLTQIILLLVCQIIYFVTYEPNTSKKVTMRKIKRIRKLTKFKLWLWKHFGWYFKFIHKDKYLNDLQVRLGK